MLIDSFAPNPDAVESHKIEIVASSKAESASRAEFGKLRSLELFRELKQAGAFAYPKLPDSGLSIDTSQMSPYEAAIKICECFSLGKKASQ